MLGVDYLRKLRNKLTAFNAVKAEFNVLHDKLDELKSIENLQSTINELQNKIDASDSFSQTTNNASSFSLKAMDSNQPIRITFIFQHPSIWPVWRSIWEACMADSRVIVDVVLTPFIHPYTSGAVTYDELRELLVKEGISFYMADFYDLDRFSPHVVFLQSPYEETRPAHLRVDEIVKRFSKVAYIPYGLEMGGGSWNITSQFDLPVQRNAWRIFARSVRHRNMFAKYCQSGNGNVVVTGHSKFDSFKKLSTLTVDSLLLQKINGRKVLLWTPHFAVGLPATWSTYRLYSEAIFNYMNDRPDLFLLMRPHPLFFQSMRQHNVWDLEGELAFRKMIEASSNFALDEAIDYLPAFSIADALMSDVGSFLLEFLPTKKPILYLHHPEGMGMNDDSDLVEYLYSASDSSDILEFIEMCVAGKDPKRSKRLLAVDEFLFGLDGNAGKRICEHIVTAIKEGDDGSPSLVSYDDMQGRSDSFWLTAENTYLAPKEYYDLREKILDETISNLSALNNVIDIGCGDGRYTQLLSKYADEVKAYDISPLLIEKAKLNAKELNLNNIDYYALELDEIKPLEKYNLITCMGVTSCIIDDIKFIRIIDKFVNLIKKNGYLLLIDTLSTQEEQLASDESGYVAKYRAIDDYCRIIKCRGFSLQKEIMIKTIDDRNMINKLFLFKHTVVKTDA